MAGVNRVILLGHLGRDPEMRYMPDGKAIANLNLATSESFKDRDGNRQERTEWHRIVLFGRIAEIAGEYLQKGSMAYIEGKLQTRKWTDKEGQERYTTEIVGDRLQLVGSKPGRDNSGSEMEESSSRQSPQRQQTSTGGGAGKSHRTPAFDDFSDEDIPFVRGDFFYDLPLQGGVLRRVKW